MATQGVQTFWRQQAVLKEQTTTSSHFALKARKNFTGVRLHASPDNV